MDSVLAAFDETKESLTVLDIGSGDGLVDSLLIKKGYRIFGVEPTEKGIQISNAKVPEMRTYKMTVEKFAAENQNEFDYMFSLNTIEHVQRPETFVELMRFVKNFAIIITDNAQTSSGDEMFHVQEFTLEELRQLFSGYQTEVIDLGTDTFIGLKIYAHS